jgi:hypothetical protein
MAKKIKKIKVTKDTSSFTVFRKWFYIEDVDGTCHFVRKYSITRFSKSVRGWIIVIENGKYAINVSESTWDELALLMVEEKVE